MVVFRSLAISPQQPSRLSTRYLQVHWGEPRESPFLALARTFTEVLGR